MNMMRHIMIAAFLAGASFTCLAAVEVGEVTYSRGVLTGQIDGEEPRLIGKGVDLHNGETLNTGSRGFALIKLDGRPAGIIMWQLFGVTNQLLAGLGLLVVSVYLHQLGKPIVYTVAPMVLMFASVGTAMTIKLRQFYVAWQTTGDVGNASLFVVGSIVLAMTLWMIVEAVLAFRKSIALRRIQAASPG